MGLRCVPFDDDSETPQACMRDVLVLGTLRPKARDYTHTHTRPTRRERPAMRDTITTRRNKQQTRNKPSCCMCETTTTTH